MTCMCSIHTPHHFYIVAVNEISVTNSYKCEMCNMMRKLYGINVRESVAHMKWRIEFYSKKNETLLPNKVRAGSSVVINRSV